MNFISKNNIYRLFMHALFWTVSILLFAFIFRLSDKLNQLDVIYSLFFHASIILSVYFNFLGLRLWFNHDKYLFYTASIVLNVSFTVMLNQCTFNRLIDFILQDYYFVSQFNNVEIAIIALLYLAITSTIKLSKSWFELQRVYQQMVEAEKEKIDSELQGLKAQINPHFLFNSLNVIYSLTLRNDKSTHEVILKLSDILRYVIYDSNQDKVLLSDEEDLLKKYIELQKYRVDDDVKIQFCSDVEYDVEVAPLVFLTLLENAFKHGVKSDINNGFINIKLSSDEEKIYFEIENNKIEIKEYNNEKSGLGLANIKKRLALQYPTKHKLSIVDNGKTFKIYLEIEYED